MIQTWMIQLALVISPSFNPERFCYIALIHNNGLPVYVKERLPFARELNQENGFLFMFSTGFTLFSALLLFSLSIFFFVLCTVFDAISSNIDRVFCTIVTANVFVFNFHHKDRLPYSARTKRPCEFCYSFSISNDLRWLAFLLGSLTVTLCPARLDLFISSDFSICSTMTFLLLGNSYHMIVSVFIDFASISKEDALFHRIADDYFRAD